MTDEIYDPKSKQSRDGKTGLPVLDAAKASKNSWTNSIVSVVILLLFPAIGAGLAYLIYLNGDTAKYDSRINIAKTNRLEWLMDAIIIFQLCVMWMNLYPMRFKEAIMDGPKAKNFRSNMFLYKLATDQTDTGPTIILREEGECGRYNRANRSIYHFIENVFGFVIALPLAFFLFPFPSFVLVVVHCVGRIVYQLGYTANGYGGHIPGFILDTFAQRILGGLLIVA